MGLIQSNVSQNAGTVASQTGTMASAPVRGNLIIGFASCFQAAAGTLNSITDTQGNTYAPIRGPVVNASAQIWLLYVASALGGAGNQITCTFSAAVAFPTIGWAEFSGYSLLDASGTNTGSVATASASCTTTVANDLLIGTFDTNGGALTAGGTVLFATGGYSAQYNIANTIGSNTSSATGAASAWAAIAAAFKPVPSKLASSGVGYSPVYKWIGIY